MRDVPALLKRMSSLPFVSLETVSTPAAIDDSDVTSSVIVVTFGRDVSVEGILDVFRAVAKTW